MEYFFIGLSLPNESFWVNLRSDSPDNVIDNYLAQTDIGKIMLETDLQLKKDTARFTSPDTPEGRQYWDKLYKKAEELFGNENVTIPTLTRPWIVPGEIIIRETGENKGDGNRTVPSAYIYKATLKVMLEEDYLSGHGVQGEEERKIQQVSLRATEGSEAISKQRLLRRFTPRNDTADPRLKELNTYSTQLIRELIIPKVTKKVNSGKEYAKLRQVYYSLILAQWFKSRVSLRAPKLSFGVKQPFVNLINSNNLTGLTSKQTWDKQAYYQQYQKSFEDGEYNLQEQVYTPTGQVIRSYFSGGESLVKMATPSSGIIENGISSIQGFSSPIINNFTKDNLIEMNYGGNTIVSSSNIEELEKIFYRQTELLEQAREKILAGDLKAAQKTIYKMTPGFRDFSYIYIEDWMNKTDLARLMAYVVSYGERYGYKEEELRMYPQIYSLLSAYDLRDDYDIGIGIAGAGIFPAAIFSLLGLHTVLVNIHTRDGKDEFNWLDPIENFDQLFRNKRVIIFENDLYTGKTLNRLLDYLKQYKPKQIDIIFTWESVRKENINKELVQNVYFL